MVLQVRLMRNRLRFPVFDLEANGVAIGTPIPLDDALGVQ
jgi:hypothetical protein